MWNEFPYIKDLGDKDSGIDLVPETIEGDFWTVQCKCYMKDAYNTLPPEIRAETVSIESDHVDGGMNTPTRQ